MFHMCRNTAVQHEAYVERQRIKEENSERASRGEELLPVPALMPPRSPIQSSIENYHLQRFGVPFYTESDFMPYAPPPYPRTPPAAASDIPLSSAPPSANVPSSSQAPPPPPPAYDPYDFFDGLQDITEYSAFGGGDGSGGPSAFGGSYRPF